MGQLGFGLFQSGLPLIAVLRFLALVVALILLVAIWPAMRLRDRARAVEAISATRAEGWAQIGLATRPVLDDLELLEGARLPGGGSTQPATLEIDCGLPDSAARFLDVPRGGLRGLVRLESASGANPGGVELGACALKVGEWSTLSAATALKAGKPKANHVQNRR